MFSEYVTFGAGTMICAGVILTTQITVGDHCIVNLGVTVGHDAVIGDYSTVAPHATISGNVRLGRGTEIGSGAILIPGAHVSAGSFVAAGATLTRPVETENCLMVGTPAKHSKTLEAF